MLSKQNFKLLKLWPIKTEVNSTMNKSELKEKLHRILFNTMEKKNDIEMLLIIKKGGIIITKIYKKVFFFFVFLKLLHLIVNDISLPKLKSFFPFDVWLACLDQRLPMGQSMIRCNYL